MMVVTVMVTVVVLAAATAAVAAAAATAAVVVATDKHITLLFKTRSRIKYNAERCSDVSLHAPPFVSTDCS